MRVLSNGKRITYKTWLFARQSLNIVNCGFCSNRIPLYFPLCVCLCTGVTSQLFSIIWCRAWKPYIFWKHIIQADHPDHSYHLTIWPPDHLTIWPPDHLTTWTTQAIMNTLTALTTWPLDHSTTQPPWPVTTLTTLTTLTLPTADLFGICILHKFQILPPNTLVQNAVTHVAPCYLTEFCKRTALQFKVVHKIPLSAFKL